jgi:hypothetical protein
LRQTFRLFLALGVAFLLAAVSARDVESTHLKIIVGVTDDTAKWMVRQDGIVGVHRDLRLMAVRVTIPWQPTQAKPTKLQEVYLQRIRRMTLLNDRVVLSVYNTAEFAPTTRAERNRYCGFVQGTVKHVPLIHDVEIWNEANSPTYCQHAVSGFLNFGLLDEDRLGGWQAGLLYRDGTRKPSYDTFKAAIEEVRRRDTDCSKVRGAPQG